MGTDSYVFQVLTHVRIFFFAAVGFYKVFLLFFISFFEIIKIAAGDYKVSFFSWGKFQHADLFVQFS